MGWIGACGALRRSDIAPDLSHAHLPHARVFAIGDILICTPKLKNPDSFKNPGFRENQAA